MTQLPVPSSPGVSARMSIQPRRDTGPELAIRRLLHRTGLRYRVCYPVPGLPRRSIDIAFTRRKVAVFIDGCYWHGCPVHGQVPAANRDWWRQKLRINQIRDNDTTRHLESLGWNVLRFWEHETPTAIVERVILTVAPERAAGVQASPG